MVKGFDKATTNFLEELKEQILSEYDAAEEPSVLVKLLPLSHNVQGERQYEIDKQNERWNQLFGFVFWHWWFCVGATKSRR